MTDTIPSTLGNLTNLQILLLGDNQLTVLPDLSHLSSLSNFQVHNNRLDFGDLQPNINILTVYAPQEPVRQGLRYENVLGSNLTLSVDVAGTGNDYQWYLDNEPLPGDTNNSLTLNVIQNTDLGIYHCQITNSEVPDLTLISLPDTVGAFLTILYQFNITPLNDNTLGLEWLFDSDLDSISIERSTDSTRFTVIASLTDNNVYRDVNVDTGQNYTYRIRGYRSDSATYYSNMITVQIDGINYLFEKYLGDITGLDEPNVSYTGSWADLNRDGYQDLAVANYTFFTHIPDRPFLHYLYINDGNGGFSKIADSHPVLDSASSRYIALIDYDNNGYPDFFTQNDRYGRDLYTNQGNLNFE